MALQSSGAISLADLATEFGDSAPHSMSEFYAGGSLVGTNNSSVPSSGAISLSNFYNATAALVLDITSNTSDYNILTAATAAGYNAASDTTPIIVNVASGVTVSATSGNPALRTGALNAASDLTINIASGANVCGYDGAVGSTGGINTAGGSGGNGTDAIFFEVTGGSATYIVSNSGIVGGGSGGGGGGGGGGNAGGKYQEYYDAKYGYTCGGTIYGSNGSAGSAGASGTSCRAQNGSAGSSGSAGSYPTSQCQVTVTAGSGAAGGAGGVAGKAVSKNGLSVTTSGGTYYGATS